MPPLFQVGPLDPLDLGESGTYEPILTADASNPSLGSEGFLLGNWLRTLTRKVDVWVEGALAGSGANVGSGSWSISLPFEVDTGVHRVGSLAAVPSIIGYGRIRVPSGGTPLNVIAVCWTSSNTLFYATTDAGSIGAPDVNTSTTFEFKFEYMIEPGSSPL